MASLCLSYQALSWGSLSTSYACWMILNCCVASSMFSGFLSEKVNIFHTILQLEWASKTTLFVRSQFFKLRQMFSFVFLCVNFILLTRKTKSFSDDVLGFPHFLEHVAAMKSHMQQYHKYLSKITRDLFGVVLRLHSTYCLLDDVSCF